MLLWGQSGEVSLVLLPSSHQLPSGSWLREQCSEPVRQRVSMIAGPATSCEPTQEMEMMRSSQPRASLCARKRENVRIEKMHVDIAVKGQVAGEACSAILNDPRNCTMIAVTVQWE